MGIEIEHKFLVSNDSWRQHAGSGQRYRQGFLARDDHSFIRVSLSGEHGCLTIKQAQTAVRRLEYEYPLPADDAASMLDRLCLPGQLQKTRYPLEFAGHCWEIDVFEGENAGLVVAEIELGEENETYCKPAWLGADISSEPRYFAMNLAARPYRSW